MSRSTIKETYGSRLHHLLAKSELLSLTRTTNIYFLNHSLAKFPLKKFTVENITFLSIRIYGERNYYFYSGLHFGGTNEKTTVMLFKLRPDHNEFASVAFKEM